MRPGDKVKFLSEKQRYAVRACSDRFAICTKPFNAKKTFLYTIIDFKENIRGADNWYCKHDYTDPYESEAALRELDSGEIKISSRNRIELDIERVDS